MLLNGHYVGRNRRAVSWAEGVRGFWNGWKMYRPIRQIADAVGARVMAGSTRVAILAAIALVTGPTWPLPSTLCSQSMSGQQESLHDALSPWDLAWFAQGLVDGRDLSGFAEELFERSSQPGFSVRSIRPDGIPQWEFQGIGRLAAAFPDGQALSVALIQADRLAILVKNENVAVLIKLYPAFHQAWAAYEVEKGAALPSAARPVELLATDNGNYRRSGGGSFLLHWSAGQVVLTRGNIRLLSAPLPVRPNEIVLEGQFRLRDLRWVHPPAIPVENPLGFERLIRGGLPGDHAPGRDGAPTPPAANALSRNSDDASGRHRAASWSWAPSKGAADRSLQVLPDGGIRLAAPPGQKPLYFSSLLPDGVLHVAEVVVNQASPGTGIFLADEDGNPVVGLQFDATRDGLALWMGLSDGRRGGQIMSADGGREIVPLTSGRVRVRLLWGAGTVKWMFSKDGTHWSFAGPTAERIDRQPRRLGIFCTSSDRDRVIDVHEVRLAIDEDLPDPRAQAMLSAVPPSVFQAENMDQWWQAARMSQPPGGQFRDWIAACAWRTLQANPRIWLHGTLLSVYWSALAESALPYSEKLRYAGILAVFFNSRDWGVWNGFFEQMEKAALQAARLGESNVFERHTALLMAAPLWSEWQRSPFSEPLFRHELLRRTCDNDGVGAVNLAIQPLYWMVPGQGLVSPAMQQLATGTLARYPEHCPHGFITPADANGMGKAILDEDKAAYAFWHELEAMLGDRAWNDAAQRIWSTVASQTLPRFMPHPEQSGLTLGYSDFVQVLERRHEALTTALREKYQEQAEILLREAQRRGDERAASCLAEGFGGLLVSSQAAEWLGDRRAVLGRFAEAESWYAVAAAHSANQLERQRIADKRLRALGGFDLDHTAADDGSVTNPPDFTPSDGEVVVALESPPAAVVPLFALPADRIVRPNQLPERDFDWPRRHIGLAATENRLIINNQRDVSCYSLEDGALIWEQRLGGSEGKQPPVLAAMWPVLKGDRLFCRRATPRGVEVASLSLFDGQVFWNVVPLDGAISDPWFVGDEMFVLAADHLGAGQVNVILVALDPHRGTMIRRKDLLPLRRVWDDNMNLLVSVTAGAFFAHGEGVVFRADYSGRVAWLRDMPWIPPRDWSWWQASSWYLPIATPPLLANGRVHVHQPGSWTVQALAADTGELLWTRTDGRLLRILAAWDGQLWTQAEDGLLVFDGSDGQLVRVVPFENLLAVGFLPRLGKVWCVTSRELAGKAEQREWRFHWLDAGAGDVVREVGIPSEGRDWSFFGPMVASPRGVVFLTASRTAPTARRCYRVDSPNGVRAGSESQPAP